MELLPKQHPNGSLVCEHYKTAIFCVIPIHHAQPKIGDPMAHSIFLKLAAGAVALSMMVHPAAAQNAPAAELTQADKMPKTQDIDLSLIHISEPTRPY